MDRGIAMTRVTALVLVGFAAAALGEFNAEAAEPEFAELDRSASSEAGSALPMASGQRFSSTSTSAAPANLPRPRWTPSEGASLIGTRAPDWRGIEWIQGGPLALSDLRGKVVLLRFWLVGCPYCTRSAPALRELSESYKDRGLVVVGLHHPKADALRDPDTVARAARALGFEFPIGLDNEWKSIRAYGVGHIFQRFTSVSFVIDRDGIIRFVHDGGEFHTGGGDEHRDCNAAYDALVETIEESLSQDRDEGVL